MSSKSRAPRRPRLTPSPTAAARILAADAHPALRFGFPTVTVAGAPRPILPPVPPGPVPAPAPLPRRTPRTAPAAERSDDLWPWELDLLLDAELQKPNGPHGEFLLPPVPVRIREVNVPTPAARFEQDVLAELHRADRARTRVARITEYLRRSRAARAEVALERTARTAPTPVVVSPSTPGMIRADRVVTVVVRPPRPRPVPQKVHADQVLTVLRNGIQPLQPSPTTRPPQPVAAHPAAVRQVEACASEEAAVHRARQMLSGGSDPALVAAALEAFVAAHPVPDDPGPLTDAPAGLPRRVPGAARRLVDAGVSL